MNGLNQIMISLLLVFPTSCFTYYYSPSELLDKAVNLNKFPINEEGWELAFKHVGTEKCISNDCVFSCLSKITNDTEYTVHVYREISTDRVYIDKYIKRYLSKKQIPLVDIK